MSAPRRAGASSDSMPVTFGSRPPSFHEPTVAQTSNSAAV